jgi:hypothetical protein
MRTGWLLLDGRVLAAAEWADSTAERGKGLLGRTGYEGAMVLPRTRSVHTLGMRFALDVAFADGELTVLETVRLATWRVSVPRWRCRCIIEAEAGSFERWGLAAGAHLEFQEAA